MRAGAPASARPLLAGHPSLTEAVFYAPASGSHHWRELRPGTAPWGIMVLALQRAHDLLVAEGHTSANIVPVLLWTHGEADADEKRPGGATGDGQITQAQYVSVLTQLRAFAQDFVRMVWDDETRDVSVFVTPLGSGQQQPGCRTIQNAQVEAGDTVPGIVLLTSPLAHAHGYESDGIHLTGATHRTYAESGRSRGPWLEHVEAAAHAGGVARGVGRYGDLQPRY